MEFTVICRNVGEEETWEEKYDENVENPRKWAEKIIKSFNETLRPYEKPRELVDVVVLNAKNNKHEWEKRTDGMSVRFRGHLVDLVYCKRCGITGKRYGMSHHVKIDSKYRKKAFKKCDTALEELRKNPNKYR